MSTEQGIVAKKNLLQVGSFPPPGGGANAPAIRLVADDSKTEVAIEYWFDGIEQIDETIASLTKLREMFYKSQ